MYRRGERRGGEMECLSKQVQMREREREERRRREREGRRGHRGVGGVVK
jgi:hypothetical protein